MGRLLNILTALLLAWPAGAISITLSNLNVGTVTNDGTGESLRDGGIKINNNWTNISTAFGTALATNGNGFGLTSLNGTNILGTITNATSGNAATATRATYATLATNVQSATLTNAVSNYVAQSIETNAISSTFHDWITALSGGGITASDATNVVNSMTNAMYVLYADSAGSATYAVLATNLEAGATITNPTISGTITGDGSGLTGVGSSFSNFTDPTNAISNGKYLAATGTNVAWVSLSGGGDMAAATYDTDTDSIVDSAEGITGALAADIVTNNYVGDSSGLTVTWGPITVVTNDIIIASGSLQVSANVEADTGTFTDLVTAGSFGITDGSALFNTSIRIGGSAFYITNDTVGTKFLDSDTQVADVTTDTETEASWLAFGQGAGVGWLTNNTWKTDGTDAVNNGRGLWIGTKAGTNATGGRPMGIGYGAGMHASNANYATLIGFGAGKYSTNTSHTTAIGYRVLSDESGSTLPSAIYSTIIGSEAGRTLRSATNSILIGDQVGNASTNLQGVILLGQQLSANNLTNVAILGGSNIATTVLMGNVNIASNLTVSGSQTVSTATVTNLSWSGKTNGIVGIDTDGSFINTNISSAAIAYSVTNETGSGSLVFSNAPTIYNATITGDSGRIAIATNATSATYAGIATNLVSGASVTNLVLYGTNTFAVAYTNAYTNAIVARLPIYVGTNVYYIPLMQ